MNIEKIIRHTVRNNFTCSTNKRISESDSTLLEKVIFTGVDGKNYEIAPYSPLLIDTTCCYSYALGWRLPFDSNKYEFYPGFLCGKVFDFQMENSIDIVRADLGMLGRKSYEVITVGNIPKKLPKADTGTYWIKALVQIRRLYEGILDIHFMAKDPMSGRWIHKPGWELPPQVVMRVEETDDDFYTLQRAVNEDSEVYNASTNFFSRLLEIMLDENYTGTQIKQSIEEDDNHPYSFYEPRVSANPIEYETLWVMRISE